MSQTSHSPSARLIEAYLAERITRGDLAASSTQAIRATLHQWARHIAPVPPSEWTEKQVLDWIHDERLRPTTRKMRKGRLRPWLRWLTDGGVIPRDPSARAGRIVIPDGTPRDFTPEEVGAILGACPDQRSRLIVLLMAQCGLRCGDVARIRIEDIDARRQSIHVRAKGGRGEPTHWVPVPRQAWRALSSWRTQRTRITAGPLITSQQSPWGGLTPAHISVLVSRAIQAAGLKGWPWDGRSPHGLRHSCAQHMIDSGADLRDAQHALGHRTIRSTEIYVRREPPGLRAAMEGRDYADRPAA